MKALVDSDIMAYSIAFKTADEDWDHVASTVDAHIREIVHNSGCDDYQLYLTGSQCWRREKYLDYKAGRTSEKPKWHSAIREYLISDYNAEVTDDGREADDVICSMQMEEYDFWGARGFDNRTEQQCCKIVACSSDKDFNIVPGWHYNPKWKVKYWVTQEDADLWFACQLILGDKVDDIEGLDGWGKVRCVQIISDGNPIQRSVTAYKYYYGVDWVEPFKKAFDLLDVGQTRDVDDYIRNVSEA